MRNLLLFVFACILSMPSYAQITCNAAISTSVSSNVVTLTNSSTPVSSGMVLTYYNITWGDATTTNTFSNAAQMHTYTAVGTYNIRLIQNSTDSSKIPVATCRDTAYATAVITSVPVTNVISGVIWVDSTSTKDTFKVWLIKFDSTTNILSAADSQIVFTIAGSGNYAFNSKAAGTYRTKAARLNGPSSGIGYVPTYHDSDLLWSGANLIVHTGGSSINKHIYMRKGTITSGPGFVGGNVSMGANKGTASGIAGMNILLLDAANNPVAYAITDANGNYGFSNLPQATYKVHPEDMNYTTTAASLSITSGQHTFQGINFERSLSQKTIIPKPAGINNINNKQLDFAIYPNPANNVVKINWASYTDDAATITITDISGKKAYSAEVHMNENTTININELQTGFYFLNVATEFGTSTQKLVVQ